jgi:hypothetical protein
LYNQITFILLLILLFLLGERKKSRKGPFNRWCHDSFNEAHEMLRGLGHWLHFLESCQLANDRTERKSRKDALLKETQFSDLWTLDEMKKQKTKTGFCLCRVERGKIKEEHNGL